MDTYDKGARKQKRSPQTAEQTKIASSQEFFYFI